MGGRLNVLLIPFQQWQQRVVDSWIPFLQALEQEHTAVRYYELPTIRQMNAFSRTMLNEGMRAGIPDPVSRERTITLYLDKTSFRRSLQIPHEEDVHILLVDRTGLVLWRETGVFTTDKGVCLTDVVGQQEINEKSN